jgi:thiol-disulfide isomerase/thioredoxin
MQITDFRGRITILNFWATWCPPCVRELPALSTFAQEQDPETGVLVVGINGGETPEIINTYFDQYHISGIQVLLDTAGAARSLYGVINMPQTFFIDAEGIVRFFKVGELTREDIDNYITELESNS